MPHLCSHHLDKTTIILVQCKFVLEQMYTLGQDVIIPPQMPQTACNTWFNLQHATSAYVHKNTRLRKDIYTKILIRAYHCCMMCSSPFLRFWNGQKDIPKSWKYEYWWIPAFTIYVSTTKYETTEQLHASINKGYWLQKNQTHNLLIRRHLQLPIWPPHHIFAA